MYELFTKLIRNLQQGNVDGTGRTEIIQLLKGMSNLLNLQKQNISSVLIAVVHLFHLVKCQ